MKILDIKNLEIPEVKIIKFARFNDQRGYFTEPFRSSDFQSNLDFIFENGFIKQTNESFSKKNVVRGLHFQWNPFMGKLVRTLSGRMVDLVLDIRKNSPTLGKIIGYELQFDESNNYDEWIWVPPGFAHGNYFSEQSKIEYYCSGEYSPNCESGISPLSDELDWSICSNKIETEFKELITNDFVISDKDKNAQSLDQWLKTTESNNFVYEK